VINRIRKFRVQVPKKVIREPSQMNNRFYASKICLLDIAYIFDDLGNLRETVTIGTVSKKVAIQPDDSVPCLLQHRNHNRADISLVSGNQNLHFDVPCLVQFLLTPTPFQVLSFHCLTEPVCDSRQLWPGRRVHCIPCPQSHDRALTKVIIIFADFVLQNQMIPKGVFHVNSTSQR